MLPLNFEGSERKMGVQRPRAWAKAATLAAHLPTAGAGYSRGPGAAVRALPGPVAGLRGEQAEGAGVRLLGRGGETVRQGSGSGPRAGRD